MLLPQFQPSFLSVFLVLLVIMEAKICDLMARLSFLFFAVLSASIFLSFFFLMRVFSSSQSLVLWLRCAAFFRFLGHDSTLVCPKNRVGTQSTLYLSQLLATLPETMCLPQTRSFSQMSSVRSLLLIAEIQCDLLFLAKCSASLPWFFSYDRDPCKVNSSVPCTFAANAYDWRTKPSTTRTTL